MSMLRSEYAKTKELDKPVYSNPESIQQCFSVVSIDDTGIFELNDSKYSKQYKLSDINFLGNTSDEQGSIIVAFSKVLETMPCRFSYTVANEYVDEAEFNKKVLYPLQNDELDKLRREFNKIISDKLTDANQGLYQTIYLTLTISADDMRDARAQFSAMEPAIRAAFIGLGVNGMAGSVMRALSINERMQLLYNFTHIGIDTNFKFDFYKELSEKRDWMTTIAPASLLFENECFHINGKVGKVIYIEEYPKVLEADIISKLSAINCTSYITVNNEIISTEALQKEVQRKHAKVGIQIENQKSRKRNNNDFLSDASSSLLATQEKIEEFEENLTNDDLHYFNTTILMMFIADDMDALNKIESKIMSVANIKSIKFAPCFATQREGINSCFTFGIQEFKHVCNLSSPCTSMFMPYKTQELNDNNGIYYGNNQLSGNAIFANKKNLKNRNSLILAQPGSGKSVFAKLETICAFTTNPDDQFYMVDPNADYIPLAKEINGTVISFDPAAGLYMNPLDVDFDGIELTDLEQIIYEKGDFLQTLISSCIKRDLTEDELPVLNKAVEKVYNENYSRRRNINGLGNEATEYNIPAYMRNAATSVSVDTELSNDEQIKQYSPTLQDIYQALLDMNDSHATHVAKMMDIFVNGSMNLFNHRTNVDMNNRFIVFDLSHTQENMRVTSMVVMMEVLRGKIRKNKQKELWSHIYIDEFHELLGIDTVAKFVLKLWAEVRKMNGLLTGITQNISDLLRGNGEVNLGKIFSNTECFVLLSQSTVDLEYLMHYMPQVSPAMFSFIDNAERGTGLLRFGNVTIPFDMKIKSDNDIYRIVNTDSGKKAVVS